MAWYPKFEHIITNCWLWELKSIPLRTYIIFQYFSMIPVHSSQWDWWRRETEMACVSALCTNSSFSSSASSNLPPNFSKTTVLFFNLSKWCYSGSEYILIIKIWKIGTHWDEPHSLECVIGRRPIPLRENLTQLVSAKFSQRLLHTCLVCRLLSLPSPSLYNCPHPHTHITLAPILLQSYFGYHFSLAYPLEIGRNITVHFQPCLELIA